MSNEQQADMHEQARESQPPTTPPAPRTLTLGYAARERQPKSPVRKFLLAAVGIMASFTLLYAAWKTSSQNRPVSPIKVTTPPFATSNSDSSSKSGPDLTAIYRTQISPLIDDATTRNRAATERAVTTLKQRILSHRQGIPAFTADVTSWGTRFGVIGRSSSDLWDKWWYKKQNADSVRSYVNDKFKGYILSEGSLTQDVTASLNQFRDDVQANHNRLYSELRLPLKEIKSPVVLNDASFEQFKATVAEQIKQNTQSLGHDTVQSGIAAFIGGWVATSVATNLTNEIVTQILARVGTQIATEGIEAGGSTVAGTVIGGGGGSVVGPEGTIIGAGCGLVVGAIVDWWMSKQFEAKVNDQCSQFLDQLQSSLIDGSDKVPGLRKTLSDSVGQMDACQRDAILKVLQERQQ